MKRSSILLLCLFAARSVCAVQPPKTPAQPSLEAAVEKILHVHPPPAQPPAPPQFVLRWKNGETIPGEIAAASAAELTWKSALFDDPLQLQWSALERIESRQEAGAITEPFSIALRDGSFIYGDVVAITADSISIHSNRHGDVALKRSEVLFARRIRRGSLLLSGPTGDVGWKSAGNSEDGGPSGPSLAPVATGPGGMLLLQAWNSAASLELTTPNLTDLEFRVRSSKRPEFVFALAFGKGANAPRIETWDNELVIASGNEFKLIRKIADDEREVALRICWDAKARKFSIFSPAGEPLAEWQTTETGDPGKGIFLQNKGLDLSLEFLRVREWDGKPPGKSDIKQPRIELADGRSLAGEIVSGSAQAVQLRAPGQETPADFPLADVDAMVFSTDAPQPVPHQVTLSYADGTLLFGSIASISAGRAAIATSFTTEPLPSGLDALRRLLIRVPAPAGAAPEPPLAEQDRLTIQQTTLHGRFVSAGDGLPRWLPVGGVKPAAASKSRPIEITRVLPKDAKPEVYPALFYLGSGDVLPGTLGTLDRSGAEFSSDLMEARKIPAAELDAIQFTPPTELNIHGFGADAGWQVLKGDEKSVRKKNDSIEMDPGTVIAQPAVMQCSEIKFQYPSNNGYSSMRLRMFCAGTDGMRSMNLLLGNMGNQFYSGIESSPGQMNMNRGAIMIKQGQDIALRLVIGDKQIELFVNDILASQFPIDRSKHAGAGLIIEPAGLWGNQVNSISLSQFSATASPGATWLPDISADVRTQTLTVPRFRKDDPPRHALLASNGDVLRGEIEAATTAHFGFRAGLEEIDVPRDRVKAVIWLKQPLENSAAPAVAAASNPLDRMVDGQIRFRATTLDSAIRLLQQLAGDVKFKPPEKQDAPMTHVYEIVTIGGQTLGETLTRICSLFHVHYHMEGDNTVVFEADQPPAEQNMVGKSFWLKPDALPKAADAHAILVSKGVTFPPGASAQWQPAARLLSMTNTAENQDKLAALLNSDFGGALGSPTHWLMLTSGARFPLIVDKFDQDFVIGHHPVYGNCKVPISQVYAITTSAPEPNVTIKSLQDWRLVYAPEPVIPDAGGENSPMLGKAAFVFKLPLLQGGNFDLSAEKGHVVVLDFWATWCGPCVKSLPGLIETVSSFPSDHVKLIGVNQGEPSAQVKQFLETRGWKLTVAMDGDQSVGQKYGADAIPQTVIIGPDGIVAWVKVGYDPDGEKEVSDVIKRLLGNTPAPASQPPAKQPAQ